ncbi:MAG TPA: DEAD/DEAH box helicase, partial [Polyangiaceae bacterium]|nr:DEAD/DEAH box helicase [Polyangiaceae bacterium]
MARIMPVVVDSRIRVPGGLHRDIRNAIKRAFKHNNPDFFKKKNMGYRTFGIERQIKTFREGDKADGYPLELPRGGLRLLRELLDAEGIKVRIVDKTTKVPADFPAFRVDPDHPEYVLRPYQREALDACVARGNGIVRAPTGSGKTTIALAAIAALGQRAIVLLRDGQLAKQWIREIERCLDIPKKEIGEVRGGKKYAPGRRITVALQQSLYRKGNRLGELLRDEPFGTVVVDEVQGAAARTFLEVIDHFPARYRLGFSADETRKDGKEFLTYDVFGNVIYEIERDELEKKGHVLPVSIRMIPTEFRADWYRDAPPAEKDWTRLIEEIINDDERNDVVIRAILSAVA